MTTRKIKEELLQAVAPEVYTPLVVPKREIKRELKREIKGELKRERGDVKPFRSRKRKKDEDGDVLLVGAPGTEGVEFVREFAPRRRVQWKGRKVRPFLRPGAVVQFTPGERSTWRLHKRSYDEVHTDEDILQQAAALDNEFRYGKRPRPYEDLMIPLDEGNPTPSLKPVTLQQVLPVSTTTDRKRGVKRERLGDLQPTVQLMVPKRRKMEDMLEDAFMDPAEPPEVKIRPIKAVAPGIGVQTVDVEIPLRQAAAAVADVDMGPSVQEVGTDPIPQPPAPVSSLIPMGAAVAAASKTVSAGTQTDPWMGAPVQPARRRRRYPTASSVMPNYLLHPSITPTPGYRGRRAPRRRAAASSSYRSRRRPASRRSRAVTRVVTRRGRRLTLPAVRYHPSIVL
ncbi:V [Titi monkey adenovirus ECC-2011]|uniref:Penton base n=1 Tax=titi monkey adenovirus 1 TaxID=3123084 RepID=G0ZAI2_9ADEN|nr:V [Titi monkey adenovirus ECC-2011] [Titi monkey adenovirus ECC-2011]AEK98453.1 V [Titi monkey adenovirus ECC-2011] [Titi monkey adenovirus ECC-2011]